jgi:Tol biopolymer transport system component
MRTTITTLLAAALSLLVASGKGKPQDPPPQPEAPIIFHSWMNGTPSQVYYANSDGTGLTKLTNAETPSKWPAWHPGYQYISFHRDGNLCIMKARPEGKRLKPIVIGPADEVGPGCFSPNGELIVYVGPRPTDGGGQCMIIQSVNVSKNNVKIGVPTALWHHDAWRPSFSPDGTKLLFASHWGIPPGEPGYGPHIKVMDLATGEVASFYDVTGQLPTWSPDGELIAFCTKTGELNPDTGGPVWEVFVMNADFSGLTQLTDTSDFITWPSFSPDGHQLVFHSHNDAALYLGSLVSGEVSLFVANANGAHWTP